MRLRNKGKPALPSEFLPRPGLQNQVVSQTRKKKMLSFVAKRQHASLHFVVSYELGLQQVAWLF